MKTTSSTTTGKTNENDNQAPNFLNRFKNSPVSSLHKSIVGRYRPVRVADEPITARYLCRILAGKLSLVRDSTNRHSIKQESKVNNWIYNYEYSLP